ncbi:hypothetical protein A0J61_08577 [Choanephora cucurbitarum]|uniref:Uncharacterized protein n=1 Tax=Choanephora cucurbitarum TaxID=101091 RepID=A0A1C7N3Z5_9FUNG|nr:hypothetical protein A0J61_08577 [Choanephora cucurbitarum]
MYPTTTTSYFADPVMAVSTTNTMDLPTTNYNPYVTSNSNKDASTLLNDANLGFGKTSMSQFESYKYAPQHSLSATSNVPYSQQQQHQQQAYEESLIEDPTDPTKHYNVYQ